MSFEVVCLGASGTYPAPGAACSGYLLRSDGAEVWIDAGPGTLANLQAATDDYSGLRALVLTHLHLDHVVDVYSLYHWIRFARVEKRPRALPVHAPSGAGEHLAQILTPYGSGTFGEFLEFHPIGEGDTLRIGPFSLTFARTQHPVETFAVRAEAGGRAVVYTADTGLADTVASFARGADLLIAEASFQGADNPAPDVHMTAAEAGQLAAAAGAGHLVLTHVLPGLDREVSRREARERYGGEVSLAADGVVFAV